MGQERFDWPLAYEAEGLIRSLIASFTARNRFAANLTERMQRETGTDFFEWIDHMVVSPDDAKALRDTGFRCDEDAETPQGQTVLHHPRASLPRVILADFAGPSPAQIALRVERVADFIARNNLAAEPEGGLESRYRRAFVAEENGARLEAVERHGYRGFVPGQLKPAQLDALLRVREFWQTRRREFASPAEGYRIANRLLHRSVPLAGRDRTCQVFFELERAYWESRNRAARTQKFRQDRLGLGWANHDHHTFRSSREHFVDLVEFFLKLGFEKRERYYAGAEAGWGAQILEQPVVGIVVFADVDLLPEETKVDFSTQRLSPAPRLGTVGLWVALHGESFLEAGMHHLEARFDHEALRGQLGAEGINTLKPFSDFEFLWQAFTEGERWPVRAERLDRLLSASLITPEQHAKFLTEGAIGSHLENLERHGGFKGFNQKSVSAIIAATDPRKVHFPNSHA